jgi:hypothetical protein
VTAVLVFCIRVASNVFFTGGDHMSPSAAMPRGTHDVIRSRNGFTAMVLYGMILFMVDSYIAVESCVS